MSLFWLLSRKFDGPFYCLALTLKLHFDYWQEFFTLNSVFLRNLVLKFFIFFYRTHLHVLLKLLIHTDLKT